MKINSLLLLLLLSLPLIGISQNATVKGVVLDDQQLPIYNVTILAGDSGTATNENGFYELKIPANTDVTIVFTHLSHKRVEATFNLKNGEEIEFNPVMKVEIEQITTVVINSNTKQSVEGVVSISPAVLRTIKGAQPGVENILKTLPGVNISNELSTQLSLIHI